MSDPDLREKIMRVVNEKQVIKVCTRSELKAVFGLQQVSNTQFDRALNSLCAAHQLRIYRIDEHGDRGHNDYRPRIVSLHHIDRPALLEMHRELYARFVEMAQERSRPHLVLT